MSPVARVQHEFVEFIPDELAPNTIYVSMEYGTAAHACLCGCGHRVVTPITPTDWHLIYDGETISLHPSVGNWSFPCQSHYVIRHNSVIWAEQWSQDRIDRGRAWDKRRKEGHYSGSGSLDGKATGPGASSNAENPGAPHTGQRIARFVYVTSRWLRRSK